MNEFKLFVVGELSADPEKWCCWNNRALIVARSTEEAEHLAGDLACGAIEIPMDRPMVIESVSSAPSNL